MNESNYLDKNFYSTGRVTQRHTLIAGQPVDKLENELILPVSEGGKRTQGYFKASLSNMPLITVVTVVFNGAKILEETIKSVINQNYDNIEYIIIDGGSTDGTLDILRKYQKVIDYWITEADNGIYDAMNKGIDLANGEWINFMNAGDSFLNPTVIKNIFYEKYFENIQIIYGNHKIRRKNNLIRQAKIGKVKNLWQGSQFCHQATFVAVDFHKSFPFDLHTKIVADFEFFYRAWKYKANFLDCRETICIFEAGGVSDVKRIDSILGWWIVVDKNHKVNFYYIFNIIKEVIKSVIKNAIK
jgi:glycosyltransferase involved in cell wall biosynthesis